MIIINSLPFFNAYSSLAFHNSAASLFNGSSAIRVEFKNLIIKIYKN